MSLHVSPGSVRFTRPFQHIGPSRSHSGRRSTGSDPGRIGASPSHCVTGRLRRVVERDLGVGKRVFGRRKTSQNTEEHVKIPDNTKEGMTQNTVRTHEKVYIYIYTYIQVLMIPSPFLIVFGLNTTNQVPKWTAISIPCQLTPVAGKMLLSIFYSKPLVWWFNQWPLGHLDVWHWRRRGVSIPLGA